MTLKQALKNFLLTATEEEIYRELQISIDRKDWVRAQLIVQIMADFDRPYGLPSLTTRGYEA